RQAVGWHDSERNERCSFRQAGDDAVRCLPTNSTLAIYFSDDACTQLVALFGDAACSSTYMWQAVPTGCTTRARVFEIGAENTEGPLFNLLPTRSCLNVARPTTPGSTLWEAGPEVPPSAFVQATEQIE